MHWDANRVMVHNPDGARNDKRWNVYEVKLDGTGCKKLIENEEPDLEFYDGTYLPDGRIIANSNIGYQGVPCVSVMTRLVIWFFILRNRRICVV